MLHVLLISDRTPAWVDSAELRVIHIRPNQRLDSCPSDGIGAAPNSEDACGGDWPVDEIGALREQLAQCRGVTVVDTESIQFGLRSDPLGLVPFPLIVVSPKGAGAPSHSGHPLSSVAAMEFSNAIFDATPEVFHSLVQGVAAASARGADDLDQMVRDAIHELRTPLTIAIEYAGLVEEGIGGPVPDRVSTFIGQISKACRRLSGDLDDMRANFLLRLGRKGQKPEPVALATLMGAIVDDSEMGSLTDATCVLDPEVLMTSVSRLLRVAERLGKKGTPLSVASSLDLDQVKVTIDFTGIQPSERDQCLFARRAVDDGVQLVTLAGVFGLGASLAERLLHGAGGRVNLEQTPVGGRFVISLPAIVEGADESALAAA